MGLEIIAIEWTDCVADGEWVEIDDVDPSLPIMVTVGFLVKETKDAIVLAASVGMEDNITKDIGNVWTIPKAVVKSRRKLTIPAVLKRKLPAKL